MLDKLSEISGELLTLSEKMDEYEYTLSEASDIIRGCLYGIDDCVDDLREVIDNAKITAGNISHIKDLMDDIEIDGRLEC